MIDAALIWRAVLGLVGIVLAAWMTGVFLREPLAGMGGWFLDVLGLPGLFVGVVICDASPLPLTNEPLVLLATSAGVPMGQLFAVVSSASVTAGGVGYLGGWLLGRTPFGVRLERRYPAVVGLVRRRGAWAVAVAALLPIPFSLATWSAGICGVAPPQVAAAAMLRVPKTAFYVGLIAFGWMAGGVG